MYMLSYGDLVAVVVARVDGTMGEKVAEVAILVA
jgi:hypothetical protein